MKNLTKTLLSLENDSTFRMKNRKINYRYNLIDIFFYQLP